MSLHIKYTYSIFRIFLKHLSNELFATTGDIKGSWKGEFIIDNVVYNFFIAITYSLSNKNFTIERIQPSEELEKDNTNSPNINLWICSHIIPTNNLLGYHQFIPLEGDTLEFLLLIRLGYCN